MAKLPDSTALGRVPFPTNLNEALALVRSGKLQQASDLLMGGLTDPAQPQVAQRASAARSRFSGLAARGLQDVQDVMHAADLSAARKLSERLASGGQAFKRAHAPGPGAASEVPTTAPGRFARVPFRWTDGDQADHAYLLYTPEAAAPAKGRPLVLMLHGCTQNAQDFARGTRMNTAAETAGALVLYPSQSQSANANGCWNWFRPQDQHAGSGEPALLVALVRHAMENHAVDPRRVYVAGLSAGGAMAAVLAQQYPEVFAAAGVHSGLAPGAADNMMGALSAMKSGAKGWAAEADHGHRPAPLIVVHGDADATVHPRNGEQLMQSAAHAAPTSLQTEQTGTTPDGQRYTRTTLVDAAAPQNVLAEHWLLHGAGHAWSGGDAQGSYTSAQGVDASAEMLRFFMAHPAADAPRQP